STKTKVWEHTHVSFSKKNSLQKKKVSLLLVTSVKLELDTLMRLQKLSQVESHQQLHLQDQLKLNSSKVYPIYILYRKEHTIYGVLFSLLLKELHNFCKITIKNVEYTRKQM